jgi:hypothetical protein
MQSIGSFFVRIYCWMETNDLPNWLVLLFTAILWPSVLIWWNRRKVNTIRGLRVSFAPSSLTIGVNPYASVDIIFTNNTGFVVFLSYVRIKRFSSLVTVPLDTSGVRDISSNAIDMTFFDPSRKIFHLRQVTLDTGSDAKVSIAVSAQLPNSFYVYTRCRVFAVSLDCENILCWSIRQWLVQENILFRRSTDGLKPSYITVTPRRTLRCATQIAHSADLRPLWRSPARWSGLIQFRGGKR